ncbi:MAG: DNA polymerase III subunit delta [Rikenellaceae bacterium]|nr:DNA polymerase III subunit delta [Rikenellaceae bacterium]
MAKSGKPSFKECLVAYSNLRKDILSGVFSPVYLLMGEESFFIDRLTDLLTENILKEEERTFNQMIVYGKDADAGTVVNYCRQIPMSGDRNVIIVKEAQHLKKIELLSSYFEKPSGTSILVICHKGKNVDKRTPLYKNAVKTATVFESIVPRDYELGPWIESVCNEKKVKLDPHASALIVEYLGTDLSRIANELEKLSGILPVDKRLINSDIIEKYIGISKEYNNFELTKAISEKDLPKALKIVEYFKSNPKDNPYVVTISSLFMHFQRIFILNYEKWMSRKTGKALPTDMELSKSLKLPNPFFLREYKIASMVYPNSKVFIIFGLLREYDLKGKGMNQGSAEHGDLLKELILKIML